MRKAWPLQGPMPRKPEEHQHITTCSRRLTPVSVGQKLYLYHFQWFAGWLSFYFMYLHSEKQCEVKLTFITSKATKLHGDVITIMQHHAV